MEAKELIKKIEDMELEACGKEGTSFPVFILYDRRISIPEKVHSLLEDEDDIVYADDEGDYYFVDSYEEGEGYTERVPDSWFVENGYAVWENIFYGLYTTREEAECALNQRKYAFNNPFIFCESLYRSSWIIKKMLVLHCNATK